MVTTSSEARLGAIRLAWWRERLEELDNEAQVPAEPRLQAVTTELLPRGVTGKALSQFEDAWLPLLEPYPWGDRQAEALRLRGRILFGTGAALLGAEPTEAEAVGELWSLVDGACHCSDPQSRQLLLDTARAITVGGRMQRKLRSLTVLGALAVAAVHDPRSGMARGIAATRHRLTGRIPPL